VFFAIVVVVGVIAPLALALRARRDRKFNVATASALVLLGGFLLRLVIVFSAESV
jgi:formate-dependent nitrite reductase membrane component NrfD